ncbi:MAG TPA: NAD-dependent epimerase/dehydratase family protein, partial [Streptosporangiaceae bacterium]|nr:NAD-dependent epimerase/dehydratase family protein [Streptosporangiaceae bacterium]
MNILIIGGTRFLGRHLVNSALARGHAVTLFNRGRSNSGVYPQLETILG